MKKLIAIAALVLTGMVASSAAEPKKPAKTPQVQGKWMGNWGGFDAKSGAVAKKEQCKGLDCVVELKEGVWHAVFEGDCGRPYKYTIKMEGRQIGDSVMFKGTTDLGASDGGVYDWIGRANDKEFVGFYTSAHHVGVFRLTRDGK